MDSQKIYLLVELTVLPEFLDDVKGALKQALIPTLQEAGCGGMFEMSREGDPHKLVFAGKGQQNCGGGNSWNRWPT